MIFGYRCVCNVMQVVIDIYNIDVWVLQNKDIGQSMSQQKSQTQSFSIQALIFVTILLIYILTSHLSQQKQHHHNTKYKYLKYFHESTMSIFMGILTALFTKYALNRQIIFSDYLFFDIVLPIVVFSAGYGARKSKMFQNLVGIGVVGVVGTGLGFVGFAVVVGLVNGYIFRILTVKEVLLLSSVLCATDTVAAMSLIKAKKYPTLSSISFGQSILNNSISIILLHTITSTLSQQTFESPQNTLTIWKSFLIFLNFSYLFAFSIAFGIGTGLMLSFLFKKYQSFVKKPIREVGLILLNGYFTYLFAQLLGFSGVIGMFICGVVMGRYAYENVSEEAQKGTELAFDTVSYIAQAFIFAYLGASILAVQGQWKAILMSFIILLILPFLRALIICLLPLTHYFLKQKQPLTLNELKICWFNGMMRGAVAFALSLQISTANRTYLITVSLVIVIVTSIVGSTFLAKFEEFIGINKMKEVKEVEMEDVDTDRGILKSMKNGQKVQRIVRTQTKKSLASRLSQIQQQYIRPKFVRINKKISYTLQKQKGEDEAQKQIIRDTDRQVYNYSYNYPQSTNSYVIRDPDENENEDQDQNKNKQTKYLKLQYEQEKNKEMILQI